MEYHFRFGRGKNVVLSGTDTFQQLGFEILKAYHIEPDHLFCFEFANGEGTTSSTPFGSTDNYGDVEIDSKIRDRHMLPGEVMTFVYDYARDFTRRVRLVEIS